MTLKLRLVVSAALVLMSVAVSFVWGLEDSGFLTNRSTDDQGNSTTLAVLFYFAIIAAFGAMFVSRASGRFVVALAAGGLVMALVVSTWAFGATLPWSKCCDGEAHPMVIVVWFGILGTVAGLVLGVTTWSLEKAFLILKRLIPDAVFAHK